MNEGVENRRAGAWRDGRTCLARPNSHERTGTGKILFSPFPFPCSGNHTLPVTRFSLSVENEQADAGRDGQTRLARPNGRARTGTYCIVVCVLLITRQDEIEG